MQNTDYISRTLAYGEFAIGRLRQDSLAAYPLNYELLYVHAGGFNFKLSRAIDAILQERGRLSEADLRLLHETFLAPGRLDDKIEAVGAQVTAEINVLSQSLTTGTAAVGGYGAALRAGAVELEGAKTPQAAHAIAQRLAALTTQSEADSRHLRSQLIASQLQLEKLRADLEAARSEALTDPLTTLANRKHFDRAIASAVAEAAQDGSPLALLMIDIDHFKRFNDNYGHPTGDQILRLVGLAIKQCVRPGHIASRYGGDEFAIILPQTQFAAAVTIAEQIRSTVTAREVIKQSTSQNLGRITVSIGAAALGPAANVETLINGADVRLFAAKRSGRNRLVATDDQRSVVADRVA